MRGWARGAYARRQGPGVQCVRLCGSQYNSATADAPARDHVAGIERAPFPCPARQLLGILTTWLKGAAPALADRLSGSRAAVLPPGAEPRLTHRRRLLHRQPRQLAILCSGGFSPYVAPTVRPSASAVET